MRALAVLAALLAAAAVGGCGPADLTRTETIERPGGGGGAGGEDVDLDTEGCEDHDLQPQEGNLERVEAAALCLVDAERTERGLQPLSPRDALAEAARAKSAHMVEREYFAHVGPEDRDVADWAREAGYIGGGGGYRLGENLGWGSDGAADPATLVEGWMTSPGHRENILREDFEDTGMGVVLGEPGDTGRGGATYTQMFGAR